MKPKYLRKIMVPHEVKQKLLDQGPGDKALWKMFNSEVMMEQELATVEEPLKVKQLIREREAEFGQTLTIHEWALFNIGS